MRNKVISVLGCGWLGLPLLGELIRGGYAVNGSSRSEQTLRDIEAAGGRPHRIDLPESSGGNEGFFDCDVLIVTLPPRGRQLGAATEESYLTQFDALLRALGLRKPHLLYTSSTSVYGSATGRIAEGAPLRPETNSARAVAAAEQWIRQNFDSHCVLRLAGLIGPDRHPGNFYGGKERRIPRGEAPVNLVARTDVISAILRAIEARTTGTYNVCDDHHPPKKIYYASAAAALNLAVAGWLPGGDDDKIIDAAALQNELDWHPKSKEFRFGT